MKIAQKVVKTCRFVGVNHNYRLYIAYDLWCISVDVIYRKVVYLYTGNE